MKKVLTAALLGLVLPDANAAAPRVDLAAIAGAPLYFEADGSQFVARGKDCSVLIAPGAATLVVGRPAAEDTAGLLFPSPAGHRRLLETLAVRLRLEGANPGARLNGLEQLPGAANYFLGNDPAAWRTGVALFARVAVDDVYPGVRMIYYADQSARLEYDFILQPGADPDRIVFHVDGADDVRVDAAGDLVLKIGGEELRQHRPVIYQEVRGVRREIAGGYRRIDATTIGFHVAPYDRALPLVIDPTLNPGSFLTLIGGSLAEFGWAVAVDAETNVYVAGETLSKDFIRSLGPPGFTNHIGNTNQPAFGGGNHAFGDAFVAKYAGAGVTGSNFFLSYFGGKSDDGALAIAVDSAENIYITGFTDSTNFPVVPNDATALKTSVSAGGARNNNRFSLFPVDAFVAKFNSNGSLAFSTLLGGNHRDEGTGIAVDNVTGNIYVAGVTESTNFPVFTNLSATAVVQPRNAGTNGVADAFITELGPFGTNLIFSTYLGGTNADYAQSLALAAGGAVWLTGFTLSPDFPIRNPVAVISNSIADTFSTNHSGRVFTNFGYGVLHTFTNLNLQTNLSVRADAFITEVAPLGDSVLFSMFLGGSNDDAGLHITLDGSGNPYVTGFTSSPSFPTNIITSMPTNPAPIISHVFVTAVNMSGPPSLIYSTQFGGNGADTGMGIAVDANQRAYIAGFSSSSNFFGTNAFVNYLATNTPIARRGHNTNDAFVAVLEAGGASIVSSNSFLLGGPGNDQATGIVVDSAGTTAFIVGYTTSTNLPATNAWQILLGGGKKAAGKVSDAFVGEIKF